ncbi:MAG: hypothetical protein EHM47_04490 [Ignavibacteriales bacterium]|nr:MAG: hypothetical protein EHM47_04490 [Ignavibacteriales bacterium]
MSEKEFISSWISRLTSEGIKNFPRDFIAANNFEKINLPGKTLLIGEKFFDRYEIITPDGASVIHVNNYTAAKFILYANRNKPDSILMPDEIEIQKAVHSYEPYIDSIIKRIEKDYKKVFPDDKNSKMIVNEIFRQLNIVRV